MRGYGCPAGGSKGAALAADALIAPAAQAKRTAKAHASLAHCLAALLDPGPHAGAGAGASHAHTSSAPTPTTSPEPTPSRTPASRSSPSACASSARCRMRGTSRRRAGEGAREAEERPVAGWLATQQLARYATPL